MHLIDDIEYIKKHKQTAPNTYAYEVKYVNKESTMLIANLSTKIVDNYWKSKKTYFNPLRKCCSMVDNKATRHPRMHCMSSKSICLEKPCNDSYFCEIHKFDYNFISSST